MRIKMITVIAALFISAVLNAADSMEDRARSVDALIKQQKYAEAEKALVSIIADHPRELFFYSQMDIALNGQKKYAEAEAVRTKLLKVWIDYYKDQWIKKGKPKGESAWARMVDQSSVYHIIGCEYFEPERMGDDAVITNYFKILAINKKNKDDFRVFKLEMSDIIGKYYVLCEYSETAHSQIIPYGDAMPTLRVIMEDLKKVLDKK